MSDPRTIDRPAQLKVPHGLREEVGLQADAQSQIDARGDALRNTIKSEETRSLTFEERMQRIQEVAEKYGPSTRDQILSHGFASIDEYVADMRGR